MRYSVCFTQYFEYEVEAENEDEAFDEAFEEFESDMRCPIANTNYDDVEIREIEEE